MSKKKLDSKNRWRNKVVAFRVSPQEGEKLDRMVALSGLTKQEYLCRRVLDESILVKPSPRILKNLSAQLEQLHLDIEKLSSLDSDSEDCLETLSYVTTMLAGLAGGAA